MARSPRCAPRSVLAVAAFVVLVGACARGPAEDAVPAETSTTDESATTATSTTRAPAITTTTEAPLGFPLQPPTTPWPTDQWARADWPAGVDRTAVEAAADHAFNEGRESRVRALIVVHEGRIVLERYSGNRLDGPGVAMEGGSIAKSVTAAAVGVLVRDGLLDTEDTAPIPEWQLDPDDRRRRITVDQLLHMSAGLPWNDGFTERGTTLQTMLRTGDVAREVTELELSSPPGQAFTYSTGASVLLARIVGDTLRSTGGRSGGVPSFLDRELFDPIGVRSFRTDFDRAGTWMGGDSVEMTPQDYARFGLLFLRGGTWDGEQILPESWVEYSRTPSPTEPEFGAHWWLDPLRPGVSYARGFDGQAIAVDPMHDLVVVQLATAASDDATALTDTVLDAFAAAADR